MISINYLIISDNLHHPLLCGPSQHVRVQHQAAHLHGCLQGVPRLQPHHDHVLHRSMSFQQFSEYLFSISGTTFSRFWQIRVDQIPCGTLYTPPQVVLHYYQVISSKLTLAYLRGVFSTTWSKQATSNPSTMGLMTTITTWVTKT